MTTRKQFEDKTSHLEKIKIPGINDMDYVVGRDPVENNKGELPLYAVGFFMGNISNVNYILVGKDKIYGFLEIKKIPTEVGTFICKNRAMINKEITENGKTIFDFSGHLQ